MRRAARQRGSVCSSFPGRPCRSRFPRFPWGSLAEATVGFYARPHPHGESPAAGTRVRPVSLTLDEARERASLLSDVSYDLHLDLTDREHFVVTARIGFACSRPGASTFL